MKEEARRISVLVQQDNVFIQPSNYSQSIRDGWFVISLNHVPAKNAIVDPYYLSEIGTCIQVQ